MAACLSTVGWQTGVVLEGTARQGMTVAFALVPAIFCAAGALLITGIELAVGLLCNRCLHWAVWDYSDQWGNLWGQICPQFSFYWFLLSIPLLWAFERAGAAAGRG